MYRQEEWGKKSHEQKAREQGLVHFNTFGRATCSKPPFQKSHKYEHKHTQKEKKK